MSSTNNGQEREKKLNAMKVMILMAEKKNLNTREKNATQMAEEIIRIIKNVHNRSI